MRSEFLPFSRPSITEEEINAVADVLRSKWITTGLKRTEFENKFCDYVRSSSGVTLPPPPTAGT